MNRLVSMVVLTIVLAGFVSVQAQNGFVVWSKDGGCERELHFNKLEDGKVGEPKLVIKRGVGADIWPHISYDGVWVAWSRAVEKFSGRYGQCDYHGFEKFDIYIGKLNNGEILPVEGIKIAHGYFPSWGEDAKDPNKPKTLYFTHYETQTIKKTTVSPDGKFTEPVEHHKFSQKMGSNAHVQMSPDGKFLLYRPGKIKCYSLELKKDISGDLGGCHPCWGPRSKYFIRSQNGAYFNTGTSVKSLGKAGVGSYFQGLSNDAYWDEGKLWVIGRIGGKGQNGAGSVEFKEVGISNDGKWELGSSTKVGSGSACDIHVWPPGGPPKATSKYQIQRPKNTIDLNTRLIAGTAGMQLIIESIEPAFSAGLFDIQGLQKAYIGKSADAQTTIPLKGIADGVYMLRFKTDKGAVHQTIRIAR